MDMEICAKCGTRVLPKTDGSCPNCRERIAEPCEGPGTPPSASAKRQETSPEDSSRQAQSDDRQGATGAYTGDLASGIFASVADAMGSFGFSQRHTDVQGEARLAGVVGKAWNPFRRIFGGHGLVAVAAIPEDIPSPDRLVAFFSAVRKTMNAQFVGFAAYKSTHSFVVLLCPHALFPSVREMPSKLKDRSGLHLNIIQGVILVDAETREVVGDYTRPAQHKREYEAVLSATTQAIK